MAEDYYLSSWSHAHRPAVQKVSKISNNPPEWVLKTGTSPPQLPVSVYQNWFENPGVTLLNSAHISPWRGNYWGGKFSKTLSMVFRIKTAGRRTRFRAGLACRKQCARFRVRNILRGQVTCQPLQAPVAAPRWIGAIVAGWTISACIVDGWPSKSDPVRYGLGWL